jgi:ribosomal protein L11 methylase PrmA
MHFYLYLIVAILLGLFYLSIIIYFGRSFITGAPYAVTTPAKVKQITSLLTNQVNKNKKNKAVDLGSGDGRLVIALAQAGFEAHGFETNPYLVWLSRWRIKKAGLQGRAFIHAKNYWPHDLSQYDVVTLFGVFYMMNKMKAKLKKELKPGALIASNYFHFPDWPEVKKKNNIYIYQIATK